MIIIQVHLVLGHSKMCSFVPRRKLRERAIGMLTARISTRTVPRQLNVHFSTISQLQPHFKEFGSTSNRPHNRRPRVWRRVDERFADVNVVNIVTHDGGGVMLWAGINYGQQTQLDFIDGNLNAQKYSDEILRPILMPIFVKVSVTNRFIYVFPVM